MDTDTRTVAAFVLDAIHASPALCHVTAPLRFASFAAAARVARKVDRMLEPVFSVTAKQFEDGSYVIAQRRD